MTSPAEKAANAIAGLNAINHYIETQMALGNWPYDNVWAGDVVILALVDTYEAVGDLATIVATALTVTTDDISAVGRRWTETGEWGWG